ncbi:MAG: DUF2516 family protein [Patescibacteria group bacterium]|mgnify:CR=1 FL=1|nr:DUF2516 family protein [Patescibacteria group bacterium]
MNKLLSYAGELCNGQGCKEIEMDPSFVTKLVAILGGFVVFLVFLLIISFGFWLWMLIDALRRKEEEFKKINSGDKILWLVILLVSLVMGLWFVAALVYFFVIYRALKTKNKK